MAAKRERWTVDKARAVLAEAEASDLSLSEFARRRGLRPKRLLRWRARFAAEAAARVPRMVELVPGGEAAVGTVLVHCPSGHRVEVADVDLAVGLRAALAAVAELSLAGRVSSC